jgi:hypothetical protein
VFEEVGGVADRDVIGKVEERSGKSDQVGTSGWSSPAG